MYRILLLTHKKGKLDLRQTPEGKGVFGEYAFHINEEMDDPDFLVVHNKVLREERRFQVAPANTILLTSEPYSVLGFPTPYCRQFGTVCSCQEEIKLPNTVYTPAILPWFAGLEFGPDGGLSVRLNYEDIENSRPQKTKLISVITSNKTFTKGHRDRLGFVEKLQNHYGGEMDVFGRGYRDFADKWDVLSPYKYHIAIENSSSDYYWTEKLSDCFLANTYPFYYGCRNIHDYFPENSLTAVDIRHFEEAVERIDRAMADDTFRKRQAELAHAKRLVMEKYNMFNYIVNLCARLDARAPKKRVTIKPASHFFDLHNFYLYTIGWNISKLKGRLYAEKGKRPGTPET